MVDIKNIYLVSNLMMISNEILKLGILHVLRITNMATQIIADKINIIYISNIQTIYRNKSFNYTIIHLLCLLALT